MSDQIATPQATLVYDRTPVSDRLPCGGNAFVEGKRRVYFHTICMMSLQPGVEVSLMLESLSLNQLRLLVIFSLHHRGIEIESVQPCPVRALGEISKIAR